MKLIIPSLIILLLNYILPQAKATEMARLSLEEMVVASDYIIIGVIKNRIELFDETELCPNKHIVTIAITQKLKMKEKRKSLQIESCRDAIIEDPTFFAGEKCFIFVKSLKGKVVNQVLQGYYGKLTIDDNIVRPVGIIDFAVGSEIELDKFIKSIKDVIKDLQ